ncbi:phosphonate C-P lyase system protein PhnG [Vibrio genomosp. F10 str. 9ZC157]|uniref:Phosphonate C-P lyase system protein PhnG n=1 Tax=Vibrio genomosp. F10 str. ZF-129 TaxID=1187848 RepID=A0A1E5BK45_9VIBR|nr:phosphonate C-P lyase system protein PhnG [Vibrio genomosp. F10]OEE38135.1 phosphonate C-P lyase system protein PhnG [Vibrio genomosp. F10 str. ZF-129]OEE97072.1 phosphonate C-P lyase system protein PhnG [Vibrio genomosp. F10 str. 9ZC157]
MKQEQHTQERSTSNPQEHLQRKRWMSVLALCDYQTLKQRWDELSFSTRYHFVREPEIGLAQVRAKMGASGDAFNMGDVTIVRTVVQLDQGALGYSYITGRNKDHAEVAAVVDALMQTEFQSDLYQALIEPLAADIEKNERIKAREVSTSKVDFFTMVRGEDE